MKPAPKKGDRLKSSNGFSIGDGYIFQKSAYLTGGVGFNHQALDRAGAVHLQALIDPGL
jgi:hypothetical protein